MQVGYADNGELGAGTFAGQSIDGSTMIFMMTFAGDSDLDGAVNTIDFNRLAGNFGATGTNWLGSDFDYNHVVDSIDFDLFMTGYGQKLPATSRVLRRGAGGIEYSVAGDPGCSGGEGGQEVAGEHGDAEK